MDFSSPDFSHYALNLHFCQVCNQEGKDRVDFLALVVVLARPRPAPEHQMAGSFDMQSISRDREGFGCDVNI